MKKIRTFELVAAALLMACAMAAGGAQNAPKAPNIVLVVGDDWGFSAMKTANGLPTASQPHSRRTTTHRNSSPTRRSSTSMPGQKTTNRSLPMWRTKRFTYRCKRPRSSATTTAVSPLSTYKQWAGEGALRTPLIVSGIAGMPQQALSKSFVHVTDIAPTLLQLAGIPPHQGRYQDRDVEPMRGNSMLALLTGKSEKVHAANQPIGYELQGNSALFRGDYKIVLNLAPVGDGQWHLYDIAQDPGEVLDLRTKMPALHQEMLQDYAAYVRDNQVLPIPPGYDYRKQGLHYALTQWFWPTIKWPLLLGTLFLIALYGGLKWRVRRRVRK